MPLTGYLTLNPLCVEPRELTGWSTCPPAPAQAQAQAQAQVPGFSLADARLLAMPPSNGCQFRITVLSCLVKKIGWRVGWPTEG